MQLLQRPSGESSNVLLLLLLLLSPPYLQGKTLALGGGGALQALPHHLAAYPPAGIQPPVPAVWYKIWNLDPS